MSLNKVMLIGNIGQEPEIRYVDKGTCTARLRLATSTPGYKLPNGTEVPERTEWHNILLWGRLAQVAERYIHKGDKLYVEGSIRTNVYTDRQGKQRYSVEIWGSTIEMLTPRAQSQAHAAQAQGQAAGSGAQGASSQDTTTPSNPTTPPTQQQQYANLANSQMDPNSKDFCPF